MSKSMYYAGGYSYPVLWGDGSLYTGHAKGISRLSFDEDAGVFQLEGVQEPVLNPSYLIMNAAGTRLYCVNELDCFNETEGGAVSAYRADSEGGLVLMGQAATLGASPCHLQLAPDESFLCVSNYNGGSLRVLPLGADGTFGGQGTLIQHTGRGVNALRQEKPHVHSLVFSPDGQWAVMADLGLDQLCIHRVSGGGLHQEPLRILHTPVGSGPRVARYHPRKSVLYCVCEHPTRCWSMKASCRRRSPSNACPPCPRATLLPVQRRISYFPQRKPPVCLQPGAQLHHNLCRGGHGQAGLSGQCFMPRRRAPVPSALRNGEMAIRL